ncbi:MAG TPA: amidohydrolase family protein [Polyangiaceae bacterium]|nr:amidohydrolase family protein [Polyangiaceae bacterium]
MPKKSEPDPGDRLPIKLGPTSNGEYFPTPLSAEIEHVQHEALRRADRAARRLGMARRDFLQSTSGAATVLLALNAAGCAGQAGAAPRGGRYAVPPEAEHERAAADTVLAGDEFIFDVQTHHVSGERPWYETPQPNLGMFLRTIPHAQCGAPRWVDCFTRDPFVKEVFFDSDTQLGVLSALWGTHDINALSIEEAALTRERMAMVGAPRLRIHGIVLPRAEEGVELGDRMHDLAETWKVAAWKLYPVWGENGHGYRLDDPATGLAIIERGLALGVPLFAVHKGLPLPGMDPAFTSPLDVGPAAKAFPRATFLIYHSGFEPDRREGPYDPNAQRGVDALIRSVEAQGIGKQGNVYAELGSLWREVMKDPEQAAHVIGKLLAHFGEDRILWGTDAIWYGSPQDQIQAFRAFEISPEFQERYGYPALTREAKAKIFGLNAARVYGVDPDEIQSARRWDPVRKARNEYVPSPSFQTYGPRTRREMLTLLRLNRGQPG